jgi:Raf kinase inhibitor-like YbhB/YbcL family protein
MWSNGEDEEPIMRWWRHGWGWTQLGIACVFVPATLLDCAMNQRDGRRADQNLEITSPAFAHEDTIPIQFTCDGEDVSPPLAWSGAPVETKAYVLICEDPDAPGGTWDHWILYNIPAEVTALPAGQEADSVLFGKVARGLNSWKSTAYGGPCPPPGEPHHYHFRLFALYAPLDLPNGAAKDSVLAAMQPLVVARGEMVGLYGRRD